MNAVSDNQVARTFDHNQLIATSSTPQLIYHARRDVIGTRYLQLKMAAR